jgi:hypothetical protein
MKKYVVRIDEVETSIETYTDTVLVKQVPTGRSESTSYGNREELYEKTWQPVEKKRANSVSTKIFEQTVDELDLAAVIIAVNDLPRG